MLPWVVLGLGLVILGLLYPPFLFMAALGALPVIGSVAKLGFQYFQLRRSTPVEMVQRDEREETEARAIGQDIELHLAATSRVATYSIASGLGAILLIEMIVGGNTSLLRGALVKPLVRSGQWWRLLTSSFMHASLVHFLANVSALRIFGGLIEAYDRPLRVPLVYLAAVIGGSLASTWLISATSLGASAGRLGLAGYPFVVAGRNSGVPGWVRKMILSTIVSVGVLGLAGFAFIDNAAHAGGLLAGMLVGWVSTSTLAADRPLDRPALDALGWASAGILAAGAFATGAKLLNLW